MNLSSIWSYNQQPVKYICTIALFLGSVFMCRAQQPYDPEKVPKKAQELNEKAYEKARALDYESSIKLLQEAIKIYPGFLDAYANIAGMYSEKRKYKEAIENYEAARDIDSVYFRDFNLPFSINLAGMGEFEKALAAVNSFLVI
jgi:tetratricopeptide (TPR) repeat protein